MTTKTCEKCGWVLAIQDPKPRCPVCNTRFKVGICYHCKKPVEYYRPHGRMCRECYDTICRKPDAHDRVKQKRLDRYQAWLDKIALIPKSYPTLTEAEWLKTVKFFDGCAFCESESIDTRQYFIPFKSGGRYCDWNIIPMCGKCVQNIGCSSNYNYNWFLKANRPPGLDKTVKYLEEKINAAIESSTEKSV